MHPTKGRNYRAQLAFGNCTGYRYSKGMVEILVNSPGFEMVLMPSYDTVKYPFPPYNKNFNYEGETYYNSDKRRIEAIQDNEITFMASDNRKGEIFKIHYENSFKDFIDGKYVEKLCTDFHLIICISQIEYEFLYKDLRKNFLHSAPIEKSSLGAWKHQYLMESDAMKWIDDKLIELQNNLPKSVRSCLELENKA